MTLKAYEFANAADFDIDSLDKVTFAESPGKAKQNFSMETGIHYTSIRVHRLQWADIYGDVNNIPTEEWFSHGWYFICNSCGKRIFEMKDFFVNPKGYCCSNCYDEWRNQFTEKTKVTEISCECYTFFFTEYKCAHCGERFFDRDDNYQFCPYCGRKIEEYGREVND